MPRAWPILFGPPIDPQAAPGAILGRPVRVAVLTDTYAEVNGVAMIYQYMAKWCERAGSMKLCVVALSQREELSDGAHTAVALMPPWPNWTYPGYPELSMGVPRIRRILALLRRFKPDIIHTVAPGPMGLAGRYIARRLGLPRVAYYHTRIPSYLEDYLPKSIVPAPLHNTGLYRIARRWTGPFGNLLGRFANRLAFGGCDTIFAQSLAMRPEALDAIGQSQHDRHSRFVQVLTGVDPEPFRVAPELGREFRARFEIAPDQKLAVYVGRMAVEKGLDQIGTIAPALRERGIEPVLVGDGPYRAEFEAKFPDVRVTGYLFKNELAGAYNAADVYLFPSTTDTFGNVVLEAMACGTPVIVTNQGGPSATVRSAGGAGVIYDPETELARVPDMIAELLADRARYDRLVEMGLSYVRRRSWHAAFEGFRRIYECVAAGRHPAWIGRTGPDDDLLPE